MEDLKLIFIHLSGSNWDDDKFTYQLLFANENDLENWDDDTWGIFPACGRPTVPPKEVISLTLDIETDIKLILAQNSPSYRMYDALDKIIPLGFEDIDDYEVYPDERLVLHHGLSVDEVENKLSVIDITPKKTIHKNE